MSDNLDYVDWHMRSGYAALGLLAFRFCWGLWGSRHARFAAYRTSGPKLLRYFGIRTGDTETHPGHSPPVHTPPGIVMAWAVWLICLVQALAGLLTSDDIFTEGPFVRYADDEWVELAGAIHVRLFWVLLVLIGGHLAAIAWYGIVRRDPLALSMFTGRKRVTAEPIVDRFGAALCAWLVGAAVVTALVVLP